jgi:hypothetical protein
MEHVIVEGRYPEPTTPEAVIERGEGQRFCFDLYRSHPVTHYLALDGAHICCVFRAPDAESVRRALAKIGVLPPERVWTASLEGATGDMTDLARAASRAAASGALVLVERDFADPVDFAAVQALEDAGSWCLDQHHIRFLGTFFAKDRRRMICLYAAPDAESVRLTNRRLRLPFERAWAARVFGPDASPEST